MIAVDSGALLAATIGFHLAFRQRLVRRWWAIATGSGDVPREPAPSSRDEQDPVRYALMIAGTMIMAFGIMIFTFTTLYGS
jgi:hypothetical protein